MDGTSAIFHIIIIIIIIVLIREVSLFQRLICTQEYTIGTSENFFLK